MSIHHTKPSIRQFFKAPKIRISVGIIFLAIFGGVLYFILGLPRGDLDKFQVQLYLISYIFAGVLFNVTFLLDTFGLFDYLTVSKSENYVPPDCLDDPQYWNGKFNSLIGSTKISRSGQTLIITKSRPIRVRRILYYLSLLAIFVLPLLFRIEMIISDIHGGGSILNLDYLKVFAELLLVIAIFLPMIVGIYAMKKDPIILLRSGEGLILKTRSDNNLHVLEHNFSQLQKHGYIASSGEKVVISINRSKVEGPDNLISKLDHKSVGVRLFKVDNDRSAKIILNLIQSFPNFDKQNRIDDIVL